MCYDMEMNRQLDTRASGSVLRGQISVRPETQVMAQHTATVHHKPHVPSGSQYIVLDELVRKAVRKEWLELDYGAQWWTNDHAPTIYANSKLIPSLSTYLSNRWEELKPILQKRPVATKKIRLRKTLPNKSDDQNVAELPPQQNQTDTSVNTSSIGQFTEVNTDRPSCTSLESSSLENCNLNLCSLLQSAPDTKPINLVSPPPTPSVIITPQVAPQVISLSPQLPSTSANIFLTEQLNNNNIQPHITTPQVTCGRSMPSLGELLDSIKVEPEQMNRTVETFVNNNFNLPESINCNYTSIPDASSKQQHCGETLVTHLSDTSLKMKIKLNKNMVSKPGPKSKKIGQSNDIQKPKKVKSAQPPGTGKKRSVIKKVRYFGIHSPKPCFVSMKKLSMQELMIHTGIKRKDLHDFFSKRRKERTPEEIKSRIKVRKSPKKLPSSLVSSRVKKDANISPAKLHIPIAKAISPVVVQQDSCVTLGNHVSSNNPPPPLPSDITNAATSIGSISKFLPKKLALFESNNISVISSSVEKQTEKVAAKTWEVPDSWFENVVLNIKDAEQTKDSISCNAEKGNPAITDKSDSDPQKRKQIQLSHSVGDDESKQGTRSKSESLLADIRNARLSTPLIKTLKPNADYISGKIIPLGQKATPSGSFPPLPIKRKLSEGSFDVPVISNCVSLAQSDLGTEIRNTSNNIASVGLAKSLAQNGIGSKVPHTSNNSPKEALTKIPSENDTGSKTPHTSNNSPKKALTKIPSENDIGSKTPHTSNNSPKEALVANDIGSEIPSDITNTTLNMAALLSGSTSTFLPNESEKLTNNINTKQALLKSLSQNDLGSKIPNTNNTNSNSPEKELSQNPAQSDLSLEISNTTDNSTKNLAKSQTQDDLSLEISNTTNNSTPELPKSQTQGDLSLEISNTTNNSAEELPKSHTQSDLSLEISNITNNSTKELPKSQSPNKISNTSNDSIKEALSKKEDIEKSSPLINFNRDDNNSTSQSNEVNLSQHSKDLNMNYTTKVLQKTLNNILPCKPKNNNVIMVCENNSESNKENKNTLLDESRHENELKRINRVEEGPPIKKIRLEGANDQNIIKPSLTIDLSRMELEESSNDQNITKSKLASDLSILEEASNEKIDILKNKLSQNRPVEREIMELSSATFQDYYCVYCQSVFNHIHEWKQHYDVNFHSSCGGRKKINTEQ